MEIEQVISDIFKEYYTNVPQHPEDWYDEAQYPSIHTKSVVDEILQALDLYDRDLDFSKDYSFVEDVEDVVFVEDEGGVDGGS